MKDTPHQILLFADRLPPLVGGVEMHAGYFIEHFQSHERFPLVAVVTKNREGHDCLQGKENFKLDLAILPELFQPRFLFFNSGRWIEELPLLHDLFPQSVFLYRTGGNEIIKAPLAIIPDHKERQKFWAAVLNQTIDCLITNSAYTEKRLEKLGIACPFLRCVGGVNAEALKPSESSPDIPTLFSAARFVPYKNHALLLDVIGELKRRRRRFRMRLAGDGPLFNQMHEEAVRQDLLSVVDFLGPLDNRSVCQEIAKASLYVQFSSDYLTQVPGG
ncbi:MAG: glycosyltransferase, partial [Parachlamydia sp.]|nr:glycosyltransferase [Parachlamydia sp.]